MEIVLDSSSLNHLVRGLVAAEAAVMDTSIDVYIDSGSLGLAMDEDWALRDEWMRTCGEEIVKQLVVKWEASINLYDGRSGVSNSVSRKLRRHGFTDTVDKLILRTAVNSSGKSIVTDDGDFWAPRDDNKKGDEDAPVCALARDELGVEVMLLGQLMIKLAP